MKNKNFLFFIFIAIPTVSYCIPKAAYLQNFSSSKDGENISKRANRYLGNPYVWGGNSLKDGIDCSAFVKILVKKETGINLPRTARGQAKNTRRFFNIAKISNLKKGDAVYFKNEKGIVHHVALVTGFDKDGIPFITHAKGEKYGIVREKMSEQYKNEFYIGKRFSTSLKSSRFKAILLKNQ